VTVENPHRVDGDGLRHAEAGAADSAGDVGSVPIAVVGATFWTLEASVPRYDLRSFVWLGSATGRSGPATLLGLQWAGGEWRPHRGWGLPGGRLAAGATYAFGEPLHQRFGGFFRLVYSH